MYDIELGHNNYMLERAGAQRSPPAVQRTFLPWFIMRGYVVQRIPRTEASEC